MMEKTLMAPLGCSYQNKDIKKREWEKIAHKVGGYKNSIR